MTLASFDFERIRQRIDYAVEREVPLIEELGKAVRGIHVHKLGERPCRSIAPVATDGGENRLSFEPLNLEIIRVVDSNGTDLVHEVLPLSLEQEVFEESASRIPVVEKMLTAIGGLKFSEISFLLGASSKDEEEKRPDIRGRVRAFRDIVEWAVTFDLASREWPADVLLQRDGLLRTKVFKLDVFPKLDNAFRRIYEEQVKKGKHRVYLVGVAKTSAVLSKLSLALLLEGVFDKEYPCYGEVPKNLEASCYNFDRTWLNTFEDMKAGATHRYQSFGRMHLVKLSPIRTAPIFPVDIPAWLPERERPMVLEYLAYDSHDTFPTIGYPTSLQKAHEYAVMTGLEMTVLGDMMVDKLLDSIPANQTEKIIRHVNLGRGLMKGGSRYGG